MKLDVYVQDRLVGVLEQVEISKFVFTYLPDTKPDDCVSLLMPVRTESWVSWGGLHPVFQVSLPEGALRSVLQSKYAKYFERFGDMELLSTVGSHLVGRLRVTAHGKGLSEEPADDGIVDLLSVDSDGLLAHFLESRAQYSGVSGAFPKVLAKSPVGGDIEGSDRASLVFDRWIVKTNSDKTPDLVLNEYFGMVLAQNVGLDVPQFYLSDDAQRLLIKRFDIDSEGARLGFEDMCALIGYPSSQKFTGSVERIVKTINEICRPQNAAQSRDRFYHQYVTCMAMRNGDAHLKNFGLLYSNQNDARLSPVYDMVTMSAYAPRCNETNDAVDMPALTFGGVRRWLNEKMLAALAKRCMISAARQKQIKQQITEGFLKTADYVANYVSQERPESAPIGKRLLELWSCGLRVHDEDAAKEVRALSETIHIDEDAGTEVYIRPERVRY